MNIHTTPTSTISTEDGCASSFLPDDVASCLGAPPLLRSESAADYWAVFKRYAVTLAPRDFIEWSNVKDQVDEQWEENRARRMKLALIDTHIPNVAYDILRECEGKHFSDEQAGRSMSFVVQGMQRGDSEDAEAIDKTLASGGLTRDALAAASVVKNMDNVEKLGRMIHSHRRRRRDAASDFERHRFAISQVRARNTAEVTDLDPEEVVS